MKRAMITLSSRSDRQRAAEWAMKLPYGTCVEFKEAKRTLPQNALMWCLLSDLATQATHAGRKFTPDEWKILCMHACGVEVQLMPALGGKGYVPWGQSSSKLSKQQFTDLIEFILCFGAENGVTFHDPEAAARAA